MKSIRKKLGQEEMVGFMMIVVIVIVIIVILLGIYVRKPTKVNERQSDIIYQFIQSLTLVTSDCQSPQRAYRSIGELVKDCKNRNMCLDGRNSCQALIDNLNKILEESFIVSESSFIKYYKIKIFKGDENQNRELLINEIEKGTNSSCLNSQKLYNEILILERYNQDKIRIYFEVCSERI
ncbi:MAG: hypothetical protein QXJ28_02015 [Candidatus Pacearchaeota archaeon]